jgi:hypothetical protein
VKPQPAATTRPGKASVAGTVTWNATISLDATHGSAVTGTMHLVLDQDVHVFTTFYKRGTYAYDLEVFGCTPGTHQEGTFDSSSGSYEDLAIAQVVVISGGMKQDFEMSIFSLEHWTAQCDRLTVELNTHDAFPGCELGSPGRVPVVYDGVDSYRISCDVTSYPGGPSVTGHFEGLLTPYFQ